MISDIINQYKILEKIGVGGMGIVYKAQDTKLDRFIALKFLPPHLIQAEEEKKRFIHEAKAASALDHPNICTIYEIDETEDGQMFIAMAYYDGESLKQKIDAGPLTIEQAVSLANQIGQGLLRAHEEGIVHRDIKPANLMLTQRNEVKIVDFGIAKLAGQTMLTKSGTTLGTVTYMSPEQAYGTGVDHRTDIWALGVVLYEMLTGQQPFKGDYEQAVIYSIMNEDPESISELRTDVPEELKQVVGKCLAKEVDERYQNLDEMLVDLSVLTGISETKTVPADQRKNGLPGRTIAFIGAGLVVAFLAFFAITNYLGEKKNVSTSDVTIDSKNRIAVFPFSVRGKPELEYLQEGMADLLTTNLDGAGELKCINQRALLKVIAQDSEIQLDADNSSKMAKRLNAGLYVLGNILEAGGRLRISASLHDINKEGEPLATASANGTAEELFKMTDDLTGQLIAGFSKQPAERLTRLAASTTHSFVALKAYLEGERYRAEGRILESISAYQRAVAEDTTFALAYYRLAESALYSPGNVNMQEMLKSAVRHAGNLNERNQLLIEAFANSRQGNLFKAQELYGNIVALYPDEVEAWVALGTMRWYIAGRSGHSLDDARKSFERAVFYDPENIPAVPYLWILSIWGRNQARADSLADRLLVLNPSQGEKTIQMISWLAFSKGDAAAQEQAIEQARSSPSFEILLTSTFLSRIANIHRDSEQFTNTVKFIRLLHEPTRSEDDRYNGHTLLANLHLTRGLWQTAKEELQGAESVKPIRALEYEAIISLYPLLNNSAELEDIRRKVAKLNYDSVQAPLLRYYFSGLISARLGENSLAQSYADSLELHAGNLKKQEQTKRTGAMAMDFSLSLRAHAAWNEGAFQKALDLLDRGEPEKWWPFVAGRAYEGQAYERYMRAELLKSLGRYEEALRWYNSLGIGRAFEFVYLPVSHFKQGEVYEKLGQNEKAIENYGKFIEMWRDCDPELRPVVAEAEESLEQLAKEEAKEPGEKRKEIESN